MPAQATFKRVVRLLLGAFKQQQPESHFGSLQTHSREPAAVSVGANNEP